MQGLCGISTIGQGNMIDYECELKGNPTPICKHHVSRTDPPKDAAPFSPAVPCAYDDHVKCVADAVHVVLLQLQPVRGPLAGLVRAVQGFDDQTLRASLHAFLQEGRQLLDLMRHLPQYGMTSRRAEDEEDIRDIVSLTRSSARFGCRAVTQQMPPPSAYVRCPVSSEDSIARLLRRVETDAWTRHTDNCGIQTQRSFVSSRGTLAWANQSSPGLSMSAE